MNVYLDTDVILDVILKRKQHTIVKAILDQIESNKNIKAYTTPSVFINTFCIASKESNKPATRKALQKLRLLVNIITTKPKHVDQALASDIPDFEDAIQYYTALDNHINYIITRNTKDFQSAQIPVLKPSEFQAMIDLHRV